MIPTLIETDVAETLRSGNKSADNLQTAMTEFRIDNGICGIAARKNPIFQSSNVILTVCIFDGPNFSCLMIEKSRIIQINNPNRNTINAPGIDDKIRNLHLRRRKDRVVVVLSSLSFRLSFPIEFSPDPVTKTRNRNEERARIRLSRPSQDLGEPDFPVTKS